MRFNILYLHETAKFSGAEESLLNLLSFTDRQRFKSFFILPGEGHFSTKLKSIGTEVFFVPMPQIRSVWGVLHFARMMLDIAKKCNIHLIHTNSIRVHIYGTYIAKKLQVPLVWHERNLIMHERLDLDRIFSFLPSRIICNSFAVAKRFLKKGKLPAKVRVIYNGVNAERFNPQVSPVPLRQEFGIRPEDIVIGITSRFNPLKGHETFFRAAEILLQEMPHYKDKLRFLVVGGAVFNLDNYRERQLRDIAEKLGLSNKTIFTGFRDDTPQIYAAMDILVLASYVEACGRVILEAMASGKPIVGTDSGGTPEMIRDGINGFLVTPKNPRALADKLALLVNQPAMAKKMGEAGRRISQENFRIEQNVRRTEEVYLELLEKR